MAEATTTNAFRAAQAVRCREVLVGGEMAFGDGGHRSDLSAKAPDPAQTALQHEVIRLPIAALEHEDPYSVTASATLNKDQGNGHHLSEAGLFDAEGMLMAFRNFAVHIKENDETYEVSIKIKF